MRKTVAILIIAGLLAGCGPTKSINELSYEELKELSEALSKKCTDLGLKKDSEEYKLCFNQEAKREVYSRASNLERRKAIGAAFADGLEGFSGGYNQARANYSPPPPYQPSYSPPKQTNCTSIRYGNTVQTSCQ